MTWRYTDILREEGGRQQVNLTVAVNRLGKKTPEAVTVYLKDEQLTAEEGVDYLEGESSRLATVEFAPEETSKDVSVWFETVDDGLREGDEHLYIAAYTGALVDGSTLGAYDDAEVLTIKDDDTDACLPELITKPVFTVSGVQVPDSLREKFNITGTDGEGEHADDFSEGCRNDDLRVLTYFRPYQFELREPRRVLLVVHSDLDPDICLDNGARCREEFDPYLILTGPDGFKRESDDINWEELNDSPGLLLDLQPGIYTAHVTSYSQLFEGGHTFIFETEEIGGTSLSLPGPRPHAIPHNRDKFPDGQLPPPPPPRPEVSLTGLTAENWRSSNPHALRVSWNAVEGADEYYLSGVGPNEYRTSGTEYIFENLPPSATYTVKVVAWDKTSRPIRELAAASVSATTPGVEHMVVFVSPDGSGDPTRMKVEWRNHYYLGELDRYVVTWVNKHAKVLERRQSLRVEAAPPGRFGSSGSAIITGLRINQRHEVYVTAYNKRGDAVAEGSANNVFVMPPLDSLQTYYDGDDIILEWEQFQSKYVEPDFTSVLTFEVYWWDPNNPGNRPYYGAPRDPNDKWILYNEVRQDDCEEVGRARSRDWHCTIQISSQYVGGLTEQHRFRVTPAYTRGDGLSLEALTVPRPPGNHRAIGWSDTEIMLFWDDFTGHADSIYRFRLRPAGTGNDWLETPILPAEANKHFLAGGTGRATLHADTEYEIIFHRWLCTKLEVGDQGDRECTERMFTEQPLRARTYKAIRNDANNNDLRALRIPGRDDALEVLFVNPGDVDRFDIQWRTSTDDQQVGSATVLAGETDGRYIITGLEANTEYTARVDFVRLIPASLNAPWQTAGEVFLESSAWTDREQNAPEPEPEPEPGDEALTLAVLLIAGCDPESADCSATIPTGISFTWPGMATVDGAEVTRYTLQLSADGQTGWTDASGTADGYCKADMAAEDGKMGGYQPNCLLVLADEGLSAGDVRHFRVIAKSAVTESQTGPATRIEID